MRQMIEGLPSSHPLGRTLPSLYQEDDFAQRLTAALDEVLAPVLCTLDNLDAYLDPDLAPADFVEWLASWVGLALDETWPMERQRTLVAQAADLYARRGTAGGLAGQVAIYTGVEPEIIQNGGVAWSGTPGGEIPGSPEPYLKVRLAVPDPAAVDVRRLDAIVAAAKPAHVVHEVEVVAG